MSAQKDMIETLVKEFYGMERIEGLADSDPSKVIVRCRGCGRSVSFPVLSPTVSSACAVIAAIENAGRGHEKCAQKLALRERGKVVVASMQETVKGLSRPVVAAVSFDDFDAIREYLLSLAQIMPSGMEQGYDAGTFFYCGNGGPRHEVVGCHSLRRGEFAFGEIMSMKEAK